MYIAEDKNNHILWSFAGKFSILLRDFYYFTCLTWIKLAVHIYFVRIAVLQYFFVDINWDCVGNGPQDLYICID